MTMTTLLAKVQFGSHLYGTSTPESDNDYRAIYLPPLRDCLLTRVRDAWTDPSEEDTSIFSLQRFLSMAVEGQSLAIEMLAAGPEHTIYGTPWWEQLRANRARFYTKSMHSFLGYAKSMSGKYSARVDRLRETGDILCVFMDHRDWPHNPDVTRLGTIWDKLPLSLNAEKTTNERSSGTDKRVYRVCGREIQATSTISQAEKVVRGIHDGYGERVRKVRDGNVDWKALMHAFRAALQCKEIVETGDLRFPLKDCEWLRDLRLGKVDFVAEGLDQRLDDLIAEVQVKMDASTLPEKADRQWADDYIVSVYDSLS